MTNSVVGDHISRLSESDQGLQCLLLIQQLFDNLNTETARVKGLYKLLNTFVVNQELLHVIL